MNNSELAEYFKQHSDLSFELSIMKLANKNAVCLDHGGKYTDRFTGKFREYDLWAKPRSNTFRGMTKDHGFLEVQLCVECKNIDPQFPIIVGAREFHFDSVECIGIDKIHGTKPDIYYGTIDINKMYGLVTAFGKYFLNYIGVEVLQVSKKDKSADRSAAYDKWSQAVNHSMYRYDEMIEKITGSQDGIQGSVWCVPILVVPNGMLKIAIDDNGSIKVDDINATIFKVGAEFAPKSLPDEKIRISNYFLFTEAGFEKFLQMF